MPFTSLSQSPNIHKDDTTDNDMVVTPADSTSGSAPTSSGQGQMLTNGNHVSTYTENDGPADSTVTTDDHNQQQISDSTEDSDDVEDDEETSPEDVDYGITPAVINDFDSVDMLDSDGTMEEEEEDKENNFPKNQ